MISANRLLTRGIEILEARASHHTTGTLARDNGGNPVAATSPHACCWCTLGLLLHIAGVGSLDEPGVHEATVLLQRVAGSRGFISTSRCNDLQGRNGALAMYRGALALLELEGTRSGAEMEGVTP